MKCSKLLVKKEIREAGLAKQACLPARATFFYPVIEDYRVEIEG